MCVRFLSEDDIIEADSNALVRESHPAGRTAVTNQRDPPSPLRHHRREALLHCLSQKPTGLVQNAHSFLKIPGRLPAFSRSCTGGNEKEKRGNLANSNTYPALCCEINYELIIVQPSSALAAQQASQCEVLLSFREAS